MKKSVIKVLTFIFLTIGVVFLCGGIIPSSTPKEDRINGYQLEENKDLDIIALGNSDLYSGFIPSLLYKEYKYRAYNTGESRQHIQTTAKRLEKAIETKPKMIMIEGDVLCSKGIVKEKKQNIFTKIYDNHDFWRAKKATEIIRLKGYVFSTKIAPVKNLNYMENNKKLGLINKNNLDILLKMKRKCDENNIKFLLAMFPSINTWSNVRYEQLNAFCHDNNIDYLDFNIIADANIDLLKDSRDAGNHLNVYGASKITRYLGSYLSTNQILIPSNKENVNFENSYNLFKNKLDKSHIKL